jgi:hypothetical protein
MAAKETMMPYKIEEMAGKPYQPSNGTEGLSFMEAFCCRCTKDKVYQEWECSDQKGDPPPQNPDGSMGCPILAATMRYDIDDAEYPKDFWTHNAGGEPVCKAFEPE